MSDKQHWWGVPESELGPEELARRNKVLSMDYAELLREAAYASYEAEGKVPIKGFYTNPHDILLEREIMRGLAHVMSLEGRSQVELPVRQNCPVCNAPAKEWHANFVPNDDGWSPDGSGWFVCTSGHVHAWFYNPKDGVPNDC